MRILREGSRDFKYFIGECTACGCRIRMEHNEVVDVGGNESGQTVLCPTKNCGWEIALDLCIKGANDER